MQKRAIITLAALAVSAGGALYAADRTESSSPPERTSSSMGGDAWSGKNQSGVRRAESTTVDRSVDTRRSDPRHMSTVNREIGEDRDTSGARTGGYLAAGIGIAALIGLFASRRNRVDRAGRSSRSSRYDDDDFSSRSGGVGPRV